MGVRKRLLLGMVLFAVIGLCASPAWAVLYGFQNITGNNSTNAAIGESQLFVDVTASGSAALFTFSNTGPLASSITDVYFDDGALLRIASLINNTSGGVQVKFSTGASPRDLPGGNSIDPKFDTTEPNKWFAADSDSGNPGVMVNGVNPGETLGVVFSLDSGKGLSDVLADLADGGLRIGIHVQGFANGGSESFVNNNPVPEPAAAIVWSLLGLSSVGLGWWQKRRRSK